MEKMKKHQTEKIRKIKAIPDRRIDFYYRLLNGPEQLKKRKKQRIAAALVIAAFLTPPAALPAYQGNSSAASHQTSKSKKLRHRLPDLLITFYLVLSL